MNLDNGEKCVVFFIDDKPVYVCHEKCNETRVKFRLMKAHRDYYKIDHDEYFKSHFDRWKIEKIYYMSLDNGKEKA